MSNKQGTKISSIRITNKFYWITNTIFYSYLILSPQLFFSHPILYLISSLSYLNYSLLESNKFFPLIVFSVALSVAQVYVTLPLSLLKSVAYIGVALSSYEAFPKIKQLIKSNHHSRSLFNILERIGDIGIEFKSQYFNRIGITDALYNATKGPKAIYNSFVHIKNAYKKALISPKIFWRVALGMTFYMGLQLGITFLDLYSTTVLIKTAINSLKNRHVNDFYLSNLKIILLQLTKLTIMVFISTWKRFIQSNWLKDVRLNYLDRIFKANTFNVHKNVNKKPEEKSEKEEKLHKILSVLPLVLENPEEKSEIVKKLHKVLSTLPLNLEGDDSFCDIRIHTKTQKIELTEKGKRIIEKALRKSYVITNQQNLQDSKALHAQVMNSLVERYLKKSKTVKFGDGYMPQNFSPFKHIVFNGIL